MKKAFIFSMYLLITAFLTACGGSDAPATSSSTETAETTKKTEEIQERKIVLAHGVAESPESHAQQVAEKFKEVVETGSNGKLIIEIHGNSALGSEREVAEGIQMGTIDMGVLSTGSLGNFASSVNALDFPFLFRNWEHAYKVLDGEVGDELSADLEAEGLKVLGWAENGWRHITSKGHVIKHPDDIKGLKYRTQENQIHLATFSAFGADPTPMAFTELFTALQQGVVDGQENPFAIIVPNNYTEVQDNMTLTGHFYNPMPIIIGKKLFDSLEPELQEIIFDAGIQARDHGREFMQKMDSKYLEVVKERGMKVVESGEFDYEAFVEASQSVYNKYESEYGEVLQRIKDVQ